MAQTNPLARDIHRPLKWEELQRGWNNLEEECEYWIPPVNIIGKIPPELNGTLLRNGPGLNEIYGKKVLHRKSYTAITSLVRIVWGGSFGFGTVGASLAHVEPYKCL